MCQKLSKSVDACWSYSERRFLRHSVIHKLFNLSGEVLLFHDIRWLSSSSSTLHDERPRKYSILKKLDQHSPLLRRRVPGVTRPIRRGYTIIITYSPSAYMVRCQGGAETDDRRRFCLSARYYWLPLFTIVLHSMSQKNKTPNSWP